MPDGNVSPGANGGRVNLQAAPGADQDWDSLFPNPELTPPQSQTVPGTQPQSQPQAQQNEFFLRSDDGSIVYRTAEDTIKGISHKDSEIKKYRDYLKETGIDPNTMQKVVQPQAEPKPNGNFKYYGNPRFLEELASAVQNKDTVRYEQLMATHSKEVAQATIQETLAPWQSTLAETNRFRAIRQVSAEIPDFAKFVDGPGLKKVRETFPLYNEMIQIGEADPVAAQRLPEVYRSAYTLYQGMNQQQSQQTQAQPTTASPNPTVRQQPTLQPSALTPPNAGPNYGANAWAQPSPNRLKQDSNEARKQLIADGDAKFANSRFEEFGY